MGWSCTSVHSAQQPAGCLTPPGWACCMYSCARRSATGGWLPPILWPAKGSACKGTLFLHSSGRHKQCWATVSAKISAQLEILLTLLCSPGNRDAGPALHRTAYVSPSAPQQMQAAHSSPASDRRLLHLVAQSARCNTVNKWCSGRVVAPAPHGPLSCCAQSAKAALQLGGRAGMTPSSHCPTATSDVLRSACNAPSHASCCGPQQGSQQCRCSLPVLVRICR